MNSRWDAPDVDRRNLLCAFVALVLVIPISLSFRHLARLHRQNDLLSQWEKLETTAVLEAVGREAPGCRWTGPQERRLQAILRSVLRNVATPDEVRFRIAGDPWPGRETPVPCDRPSAEVEIELTGPPLTSWVTHLLAGGAAIPFTKGRAAATVPLPEPGAVRTPGFRLRCRLPGGAHVDLPFVREPRLVRLTADTGLSLHTEVGHHSLREDTGDIAAPAGRAIVLEAPRHGGWKQVSWTLGETGAASTLQGDADSPWRATISAHLLRVERTERRRVPLTVTFAAAGITRRSTATLVIDGARFNPLRRLLATTRELSPERPCHVGGPNAELTLEFEPGPIPRDLELRIDDRPCKVQPLGAGRSAVSAPLSGSDPIPLTMRRGEHDLVTWQLVWDQNPPSVQLLTPDGTPLAPGAHQLPPGMQLTLEVFDHAGIDPGQPAPRGVSAKAVESPDGRRRAWTLKVPTTPATVSVEARDALNNCRPRLSWELGTGR